MIRRLSVLIWCILLFQNVVYASIKGKGTLHSTNGTSLTFTHTTILPNGFTLNVSPGAKAEGVVNLSNGSYTGSDGTNLPLASATVNLTNNSISTNSASSLTGAGINGGGISVSGTPTLTGLTGGTGTLSLTPGTNAEINGNVTTPIGVTSGATLTTSGPTSIGANNPVLSTSGASCTINAAGQSLTFAAQKNNASTHLTLQSMQDLNFKSKIVLTGQWTFTGNANIAGNGNILDISLGGTIRVEPNTSVSITDLKIRGLGIGKILFDDPSAQIRTSFIEIEMNRNYTFTTGGIYAEGPTNIVTKNNILTFAQKSSLTVDGIALTYDTTTFTDAQNIRPFGQTSGPNITTLNNGIIRHLSSTDLISQTSNAIINLSNLIRVNSNALLYCCRTSSNAIINLKNIIRTNSNAFAYGIKNNSNAILYCCRTSSSAIANLSTIVRVDSNAFAYGIKNNSNAIISVTKCCKNNSNAIVNLSTIVRVDSNAFAYGIKNNSNAIISVANCCKNNSNAIVWLDKQLQTIDHGPLNIDINQTTTSLSFDIWLSREHKMFVNVDSILDGHGHFIHFSHDGFDLLNIANGKTLVLKNVVLKGLTQDDIGLGTNSHIIFDNGTMVSLFADPDLNVTWTFKGQTILNGGGEQLTIKSPGSIFVTGTGSSLLFDNIIVSGVAGNNISCMDDSCTLSFYNTTWILDDNYSLTTGRFEVLSTLDLVGSYTFEYATKAQSIIQQNATLLLDIGSIFYYAPISNNHDLLSMFDISSRLYMNGATLASTTTGLRLTTGTLIVDKQNFLRNDGAVALSQAITFGNGSSVDDLSVVIIPGANIKLLSGILDYQNSN